MYVCVCVGGGGGGGGGRGVHECVYMFGGNYFHWLSLYLE